MNARVFFVNAPKAEKDVSTVDRFGSAVTMMDFRVRPFHTQAFAQQLLSVARAYNFDPDVDYFAMTGSVAAVALAVAVLYREYNRLQLLFFNAATDEYEARHLGDDSKARKESSNGKDA